MTLLKNHLKKPFGAGKDMICHISRCCTKLVADTDFQNINFTRKTPQRGSESNPKNTKTHFYRENIQSPKYSNIIIYKIERMRCIII